MEYRGLLLVFLFAGLLSSILFLGGTPTITTYTGPSKKVASFLADLIPTTKIISGTKDTTTALFDIALKIPEDSLEIKQNQNLSASVMLTNFGSEGPTNVSLTYIITNSNGYLIFIEHEKRTVETQESFFKTLNIPMLDKGNYLLFAELIYSNTSAIASEKFRVI